ncbi:hypothetical protein AcV5_007433 [Taiwanofungus camphoratus]|nr:hypothetical protein AcV7_005817 [Antrodia cinnamomea]KAI0926717.1 hypothetical protein AcV5_007433 [Antrodia cinnamomea]
MSSTASQKAKAKAPSQDEHEREPREDSSSSSDSDADTTSSDFDSSESDSDEEITQEFLDSLLDKARRNATLIAHGGYGNEVAEDAQEEEVIQLDEGTKPEERPLPLLDTGSLPTPYMKLAESRKAGPSTIRDLDLERVEQAASSLTAPAVSIRPPALTKSAKPLTKREKKALKNKTTGPSWFDLPAPAEADLPRLYREVEAMRLRNQLDPKRFYRREEGEGKGIKGLPKHFAIGTIIPSNTPFGTASADNLSRVKRKRTIVDELVDDAEARSYAKKKFKELQAVRGARGRGTLAQRKAMRKPKW